MGVVAVSIATAFTILTVASFLFIIFFFVLLLTFATLTEIAYAFFVRVFLVDVVQVLWLKIQQVELLQAISQRLVLTDLAVAFDISYVDTKQTLVQLLRQ